MLTYQSTLNFINFYQNLILSSYVNINSELIQHSVMKQLCCTVSYVSYHHLTSKHHRTKKRQLTMATFTAMEKDSRPGDQQHMH